MNDAAPIPEAEGLVAALGGRSIVLIGMMGAGKTSVGKRLAQKLGLPFVDADDEIEAGAQMTIPEIFERFGEPYFRDGERRVIARLLDDGPKVLSTGGGAFLNEETRRRVAERGVSVWLKPEFETLLRRVRKRSNRPLLRTDDPEATLRKLLEERSPTYALADLTIETRDGPHDAVVEALIGALRRRLAHPASPTTREVAVELGRARLPHPHRPRPDRIRRRPCRGARAGRALRDRHRRDGGQAASRAAAATASRRPG